MSRQGSGETQTRSRHPTVQFSGKPFEVDAELMYEKFGRESFALKHNLTSHPLLSIERLAQLADSLPPSRRSSPITTCRTSCPGAASRTRR